MKHIVKWAIIGLGNIALEFAKAFYNADNAELIAVASKSNEKLTKFKDKFKLKDENLYSDYEKILNNNDIDIFYVALPNHLHFEWVMRLVEKKKNILVEKPAFLSINDAKNIFNHINFKKIFFSEGYMYRYHPQIFEIIRIIKAGEIGRVKKMETNYGVNLIYKKNFLGFKIKKLNKNKRIFNKEMGGGVILDQGCYLTSMSLLIASLIRELDLSNFKLENIQTEYLDTNIDVASSAIINFDNKFFSKISASFLKDTGKITSIIGEEGKIMIDNSWNLETNVIKISGKSKKTNISKNIYSLEIENISKDIIEKKTESSFPGLNKKEIFLNTQLINNWIHE